MDRERKALRAGVLVILLAAVWRLASGGALEPVAEFFSEPSRAAFLVYLGTGRVVHPQAQAQWSPAPVAATLPAETAPSPLSFGEGDAKYFSLYNYSGKSVDALALLQQPLSWQLTGNSPTVLILHTHATESYTKNGEKYEESADFRTLNADYNMLAVGRQLARQLEDAGIGVIHDTTLHDDPSYTGSYNSARKAVAAYLEEYPSISLVLDLHRDAALDANGKQMATRATVEGAESAQLMIVVGTDGAGLSHPGWRENMALATKLHVTLQKQWEGIMRPICFRAERFNQDLLPGMLLIEVGTAGNTQAQALKATECLGWGIVQLAQGTK